MNEQYNNDEFNAHDTASRSNEARPAGRSCGSCLFGLFCSSGFLLAGVCFAIVLFMLGAPRDYALIAGGIFLFSFFWQRKAARKGCFMPFFVFAMFFFWETLVIGVLVYQTGVYKQIDFEQIKSDLKREAPEAYKFGINLMDTIDKEGRFVYKSVSEAAIDAIEGFKRDSKDSKIVELETEFSDNPGNPAVVMALADAYLAKKDLAATTLAVSLYEALVETEPGDTSLENLAEGYARLGRYDLAFTTAARRSWLPLAPTGRVARQLTYLAVTSGNLNRGIFELESLLQQKPVESEEIKLLLAGLYKDSGNNAGAMTMVDQVLADTPAVLALAREAAALKQQLMEN